MYFFDITHVSHKATYNSTRKLNFEVTLDSAGYESDTVLNLERVKKEREFAAYGAIIFCGHYAERDDAAENGLEGFVHSGKGLVVIHIASSSFEFSPRWRKLIGRVWEYGSPPPFTSSHLEPPGPFRVNIIDQRHPITKGLKDFDLEKDERHQDLLIAPNAKTHVLATATLEGRTEPMVWILSPPEGGMFFTSLPGATYQLMKIKAFRNY